ncbi:MAG: hypothetical protein LBV57_01765 [Candidatus Symbiothrix sp.]|jgi:ABC-type multidrug transport system fused ATPase/permease subunit|nr:hypothetical protein [Candidatus Symbiothrix sp.]
MKHLRRKKGLAALIFVIVFSAGSAVVMWLWNALLPDIFGLCPINFWQSAGLMILSRILLGGMGWLSHFFNHSMHGEKCNNFFEMHRQMRRMSSDERMEFIRERMSKQNDEGK